MTMPLDLLHVPGRAPPLLRITGVIDVLDSGNHHPVLCELEGADGPAGRWVVKPQDVLSIGNRREGPVNLLAELAGAEVCCWAGVPAPAIGLVRFPKDPAEVPLEALPSRWREEVTEVFKINRGRLAFCCRFLEDAVDIDSDTLREEPYATDALDAGAALFFADVYIRNDDRRRSNPNAVWLGHEVVALDHGASFVNLDQRGTTGSQIADRTVIHAKNSYFEHVFHELLVLHRDQVDWASFADRLAGVSEATINTLATTWPLELEPHRSHFVEFLKCRRAHSREIAANIDALLGGT